VPRTPLHALVSKPVGRWHLVLGKWLGLAGMVAVYTLVVGGLVMAVVWIRSGYAPPSPPLALVGLILQALVLLSLTLLGSVFVSALAAGVGVVMLHAVAMAGGMQEQVGAFLRNQTMLDIGLWVSLVLPSDTLARLAASGLQSPTASALGMVGPLSVLSPPSLWMALYAALYAATCLSLTVARFESMDL
jgi:Cu-processing system permease protein